MQSVFGMFVKHPIAGQVKTRLAAELGAERAAELYAAFVGDLVDRFRRTAERRFLCFTPNNGAARDYFREIGAGDYELWPQPGGSLGDRLAAFFDQTFERGAERVIVIGSDSPTLGQIAVETSYQVLKDNDCVLGPANDGGYYLIGQRDRSRALFADIEWSTPRVLLQTVRAIAECNASLFLAPPWYDVDTLADVEMLAGHIRALDYHGHSINLDRTREWLESGWDTPDGGRFL